MVSAVEFLIGITVAMAIPSTVFSVLYNRRVKKQDERAAEQAQALTLLFAGDRANYCLGKEIAYAILNNNFNNASVKERIGKALDYAEEINHGLQDFITGQAAKASGQK